MTTRTQSISTETLLQLLADPRRRTILHHLIENGANAVELDELTESIAADGGDTMVPHGSDDASIEVELHHTHLPKLADVGIIEYDDHGRTVRYHPTDRAEKLLQFISTELE